MQPKLPSEALRILRQAARVNALSVIRACDRIDASGMPHYATINREKTLVHPDEVPAMREEYGPLLKKRVRSHTKSAAYQRAYRQRKKALASDDPLRPLLDLVLEQLGLDPACAAAFAIQHALKVLDRNCMLNPDNVPQPQPKNPMDLSRPTRPRRRTPLPLIQKPANMLHLWEEAEGIRKPKVSKLALYRQKPEEQGPLRDQDGLLELQQPVLDSSSFA